MYFCAFHQQAGNGVGITNAVTTILGSLPNAVISSMSDFVLDAATGSLYLPAENDALTATVIRKISIVSQSMSILAGRTTGFADGVGTNAQFGYGTIHLVLSPTDGHLYVSDREFCRIKQIVIATQTVTTIAGNGENAVANGAGQNAKFSNPIQMAICTS